MKKNRYLSVCVCVGVSLYTRKIVREELAQLKVLCKPPFLFSHRLLHIPPIFPSVFLLLCPSLHSFQSNNRQSGLTVTPAIKPKLVPSHYIPTSPTPISCSNTIRARRQIISLIAERHLVVTSTSCAAGIRRQVHRRANRLISSAMSLVLKPIHTSD